MIGFYDYTVWLTYLSAVSGLVGICVSLTGGGHPYFGVVCLLFSGLFDAFDGIVARTRQGRSETQKKFGIQIDSLADLVAFGALPAAVGISLYVSRGAADVGFPVLLVSSVYMLAALIRLAYFNVTEEQRQQEESGNRKHYVGLPVTSSAVLFPAFMALQRLCGGDWAEAYTVLLVPVALAFVSNFRLRKPNLKHILILVAVGALEFLVLLLAKLLP